MKSKAKGKNKMDIVWYQELFGGGLMNETQMQRPCICAVTRGESVSGESHGCSLSKVVARSVSTLESK